jgi:hypothetical protein
LPRTEFPDIQGAGDDGQQSHSSSENKEEYFSDFQHELERRGTHLGYL